MNSNRISKITTISMTAALYTALTLGLAPISYGAFQFRLSEIMNLLAFYNPIFAPGIIIGCFISNMFSPYAVIDMIFGTLSSVFSMYFITRSKNLLPATIYPTLSSVFIALGIVISNHLGLTDDNFKVMIVEFFGILFSVAVGQFVVSTVIGYPFFKFISNKKKVIYFLKNK